MTDLCSQCRARLQDLLDDGPDAPDVANLRAHLAQCPDCAHDLAMLRSARAELQSLPAVPAPPDLRTRVRAQIEDEARTRRVKAANRFLWLRRPAAFAWSGGLTLAAICLLWLARPQEYVPSEKASKSDAASEAKPDAVQNQVATGKASTTIAKTQSQKAPQSAPSNASRPQKRAAPFPSDASRMAPAPRVSSVPRISSSASVPKRIQPEAPAVTAPAAPQRAPQATAPVASKPRNDAPAPRPSTLSRRASSPGPLSARLVPLPETESRTATSDTTKGRDEALEGSRVQSAPSRKTGQPNAPTNADSAAPSENRNASSDASRAETSKQRPSPMRGGAAMSQEAAPQPPDAEAPQVAPAPLSGGSAASNGSAADGSSSAYAPPQTIPPSTRPAPAVPMVRSGTPKATLDRDSQRARAAVTTGQTVRTRLEVVPATDIAKAALRLDLPSGVRLSGNQSGRVVVWRGQALKGQKIVVPLSLQMQNTAGASVLVSLLDETGKTALQSSRMAVGTKAGREKSKPVTRR